MNLKKGDIVGRISYKKDILFSIKKIIKVSNGKSIAILKGITVRIEADAPIDDLELINEDKIKRSIEILDNKLANRIKTNNSFFRNWTKDKLYTGKILHFDGGCYKVNKKIGQYGY